MPVELEVQRTYHDLDNAASLILQKHGETMYIFRDKLWALTVDTSDDYISLNMIEYIDAEDQSEHVTDLIVDYGWAVSGGKLRDQILVDFNE